MICDRCQVEKNTQYCLFKQNVSYFFGRQEKTFSGNMCFSCMTDVFFESTFTTLAGTWFGIIGAMLGPFFILGNIHEYCSTSIKFMFMKKNSARREMRHG